MEVDRSFLDRILADDLSAMGFDQVAGDEVVEALCEALIEYLPALRKSVAIAGISEVGFFAHALKGTVNNFSASPFTLLAKLFEDMESEAKGSGNPETINALMVRVESGLQEFFINQ